MVNLEKRIVKLLRQDARFSAETIADLLDANVAEVKDAIARLEDNGAIVKYSAVINRDKMTDAYIEAFVEIKVIPQKSKGYDNIAEMLVQFDEVRSLYLYSGNFDFGMIVEGKDIRDVAFFVAEKLSTLDCVSATSTNFVLKKYKSEGVMVVNNAVEREVMI